jgi:hypothetical protein
VRFVALVSFEACIRIAARAPPLPPDRCPAQAQAAHEALAADESTAAEREERYQGILQAMDALGAGPAAELRGGASDPDTEGPLSPDAARLASPEGGEDAVRAKECSRGSPRGVPVQNALACLQGCSSIAGKPRPALAVSLSCGRRRCALRSYVARRTPLARGTRQLSSSGSRTVG